MGRPNGHTAEEVANAIRKANGMVSLAARDLGVSRMTIYRYIDRYVTVKEALDDAREQLLDMTEAELFKAIKSGNVTAIMFTLKTIGKDRGYVERSQHEVTGRDGGPLETKGNDEQYHRTISTLADAVGKIISATNRKPDGTMDAAE